MAGTNVTEQKVGDRVGIGGLGLLALQFARGFGAEIELFAMDEVNKALDKVRSGKIRYRAVLHNRS